jgi:hypothetical protein
MKVLLAFWRRRERSRALAEEFSADLEEFTDELVSSGCSPAQARYQARRQFGNRTALLEKSREIWRLKLLDPLLRDLRFYLETCAPAALDRCCSGRQYRDWCRSKYGRH